MVLSIHRHKHFPEGYRLPLCSIDILPFGIGEKMLCQLLRLVGHDLEGQPCLGIIFLLILQLSHCGCFLIPKTYEEILFKNCPVLFWMKVILRGDGHCFFVPAVKRGSHNNYRKYRAQRICDHHGKPEAYGCAEDKA